ncbi:MAG: SIR2 family NAD-dependent protein deacylase [Planctomycetia bacterium]
MPTLSPALAAALAGVRSVAVITGAGVSKAAGLPTYRGEGGVYEDPREGDRTIEDLTGATFRREPDRTWDRILRLARGAAAARPGPVHHLLAAAARRMPGLFLLTQNVDGLHGRAGSPDVVEIHGNVLRIRCLRCGHGAPLPAQALAVGASRPSCPACGGPVRPDVVLFEEALPREPLLRLQAALVEQSPDLVLLLGTSALFPYIVAPARHATLRGKASVEVNPDPTPATPAVRHALRGTAEAWLPVLLEAVPALQGLRAEPSP